METMTLSIGGVNMNKEYEQATCPECGTHISEKSYSLECDYCLSRRDDG